MSFADLPDAVLQHLLGILGQGSYRFVAGVCDRFHEQYLKIEPQKRTFWRHAVASVPCAELWLRDNELLARMERQEVLTLLAFEATHRGRLEVVQWVRGSGLDLTTASRNELSVMELAIARLHIPIIEYLREAGFQYNRDHFQLALVVQNLSMVRYLHENGCPWDARNFHFAARVGNLEIIKYLEENGCHKHEGTVVRCATVFGRVRVLKYLFEDAGWDLAMYYKICTGWALQNGHLEIIKYLDQKGVLSHNRVFIAGSIVGQLEVLRYAVENFSSEWNTEQVEQCLSFAEEHGHDHVVEWIRNNS